MRAVLLRCRDLHGDGGFHFVPHVQACASAGGSTIRIRNLTADITVKSGRHRT